MIDGVVVHCVHQYAGSGAYTSTIALTNATLPVRAQTDKGMEKACQDDNARGKASNVVGESGTRRSRCLWAGPLAEVEDVLK